MRCRQKHFASSHNQKKDTNKFKNKKPPELPENQIAWKSDSQGVKETFIQTGRRGGERQQGQKGHLIRLRTMSVRWGLADQAVPHSHTDKMVGTTGEQDRQQNTGFQCRKTKDSKPLVEKTYGGCSRGRNSQSHRIPLERLIGL